MNVRSDIDVNTTRVLNSGGRQWDSRIAKDFLMGKGLIKNGIKNLLPKTIRVSVKNILVNMFTSKADKMSDEVKKDLVAYYEKDIKLLEKLINRDLSKWLHH